MIKIDDAHVIRINGVGEPDLNGSYVALTLVEYGNAPQRMTFKLSEGQISDLVRDVFALQILNGYWA